MRHPGLPFPPPFLFVAGFLGGLALERWGARITAPGVVRGPALVTGWLAIVAGLGLAGWALVSFFRAGTAIVPINPATSLVVRGPYAWSRNPMYLGLGVAYCGLALVFDLMWPLVFLPLVLLALSRLIIAREERYLALEFGEAYVAYCERVRRWL